jgi:hypothetical protein
MPDAGVEGEPPTERVFTRAGAKNKDAHGVRRGSGNRMKLPANDWTACTYRPSEARFEPGLPEREARWRPV